MISRVSLKDVANAAGVSLGTASQALRNDGQTARRTCERIQKIARELGYQPDPLLAGLAGKRFRRDARLLNSGLHFFTSIQDIGKWPVLRFKGHLQEEAARLGYRFVHQNSETLQDFRSNLRQAYHTGARGVVFGLVGYPEWLLQCREEMEQLSVIMVGGRFTHPILHIVKTGVSQGLNLLLHRLLESTDARLGIALSLHANPMHDDLLRESISNHIIAKHADRFVPLQVIDFEEDHDIAAEKMRNWFNQHRPEVVVGFSHRCKQLEHKGILHGRDYLFICMNIEEQVISQELYSGFLEDNRTISIRAVQLLDGMIRHGERGIPAAPMILSVPMLWNSGKLLDIGKMPPRLSKISGDLQKSSRAWT